MDSSSAGDAEGLEIVQQILSGKLARELVVSHAGRSQYSRMGGGVSACGLAALNCARIILGTERAGSRGGDLVKEIMKQETLEQVLRPCLSWSSPAHLDVDDIYQAPVFKQSMKLLGSDFGQSGLSHFKKALQKLVDTTLKSGASSCSIITRPPEIVSCFKLVDTHSDIFVIFDSHPRTKHPDGAAFIFMNSLDAAAQYLADLLKWDDRIVNDASVQWQAQLLAHFSAHTFIGRTKYGSPENLAATALDASLQALNLRAEILELQSRNSTLVTENDRLRAEVRESRRKEREAAAKPLRSVNSMLDYLGMQNSWAAGPSNSRSSDTAPRPDPVVRPPVRQVRRPQDRTRSYRDVAGGSALREHKDPALDDFAMAAVLQMQVDDEGKRDEALAYAIQREFDEERIRLDGELEHLQRAQKNAFDCGVCFEKYSEDAVARVQPCGHQFCRECIVGYVKSKVDERCYPIVCPSCMVDEKPPEKSQSVIDDLLVQQLGLSEERYAAFVEMQMATFSIILHCRRCTKTLFVDRREYEETEIITCPLRGCGHAWRPPHSCDGSKELHHLMGQQGWMYCLVRCQTPAEKISGCNHMTCLAPGCSTHFCYLCKGTIARSVNRKQIREALAAHYAKCRLFEDV
ncbi:hypothetical protein B0H21DRAFT_717226 [Amylocystis lapponica]|nr:hypothetical protein B0H21DRAFT_717226 [Amylocystis lapponica]